TNRLRRCATDRPAGRRAQVVRRRRGAARNLVRRRQRRSGLHHRTVRLGEIDAASLHQRPRRHRPRRNPRRLARGPPSAQGRRDAQGGAGDDPAADRRGHDVDSRDARDGLRTRDRAPCLFHRPGPHRRAWPSGAAARRSAEATHARVPGANPVMKTHTRVAVIGGGVVGASVLYHLARSGWTDVVLIERDELTSGSTWHAAGGMHTLNADPNVAKLQKYTIELYREIERASGQSCSIHITAGIDLAGTRERMDFLKLACARARYLGLDMEI